eukprot:TRINITY_DN1159_c0_g4_i1.p1 TRINITY_DN1159_c0_g4~~TRINITY_DN1159_c0_g4_i1.p1  ORF type:complete len:425 (-),score=125.17 TRINITY_DN1159_c0_g4_i1:94-1368(-)
MDDDDELEYTLLNKREVMVFQIPPAASSKGHKADDWKQCIWRGRMLVVGRGKDLSIKLLEAGGEKLFAQCAIPNGEHDKYVERVTDSSRYFVLKITNGARHAFIGLGFEDRNDAFDFNCSLSDFKTSMVDHGANGASAAPSAPAKDFSLKEGQKISISFKGLRKSEEEGGSRGAKATGGYGGGGGAGVASGGGFGLLPPPPSGGQQQRRRQDGAVSSGFAPPPAQAASPVAPAVSSATGSGGFGNDAFGDDFGDFCGFQSASATAAAPAAPATMGGFASAGGGAAASAGNGRVQDVTSQLQDLDLGGFGAFSGAPAPQAQAPLAAAAPAAAAQPFATPCAASTFAPPAPAQAFGGCAGRPQQSVQQQQQPQPQQQFAFDPMGGLGDLSGLAGGLAGAAPKKAAAEQPRPGGNSRDPFDEFAIFK